MKRQILKKGKKKMKNILRQNKGITLIALVITIIVLLILAGVTVASLTGENGLMGRTTQARAATVLGEAKDECALVAAEETEKYYEDVYVKQVTTDSLDKRVVNAIKANESKIAKDSKLNLKVTGEDTGAKIELKYTDNRATVTETGTLENGKIEWKSDTPTTAAGDNNDNSGEVGETYPTWEEAGAAVQGDTITIGTEKFMVLVNDGSTVTAVPYYNITLSTTNPVQSESAGYTSFATSVYWNPPTGEDEWAEVGEETEVTIDMTNAENIIQPYITAYSNKLSNLTDGKVTAEVGRYYEDTSKGYVGLSAFTGKVNSEGRALLNPSGLGLYFLGTSSAGSYLYSVYDDNEYTRRSVI